MSDELSEEINRQKKIISETLKRFQDSCKEVQITAIEQINLWLRTRYIENSKNNNSDKATPKQIELSKNLGIPYEGLSKLILGGSLYILFAE